LFLLARLLIVRAAVHWHTKTILLLHLEALTPLWLAQEEAQHVVPLMEMQLYLLARPLHVPETGAGMDQILTKAALAGIPAMAVVVAAQILAAVLELAVLAAAVHVLTIFVLWRLAAEAVSASWVREATARAGFIQRPNLSMVAVAAAEVLLVLKEIRELESAALAAHTEAQGGLGRLQVEPPQVAQFVSSGPVQPVASHQQIQVTCK
jgi:hypothetical protein